MPKITPYEGKNEIRAGKPNDPDPKVSNGRWWTLSKETEMASSLFGVVRYLKETQGWRQHQAALYARLYGNLPIWNQLGVNMSKLNVQYRFPSERPTMNVVQSCVDSLVSRLVQSKPKPVFLTSGADYKKRRLAKQLNQFIDGEFYGAKAYEKGESVLRDASILGDGLLKIVETDRKRVGLERTLCTEVFVDESDGMYGSPQQMHQLKIVDRDVVAALYPGRHSAIMDASPAYFDSSTNNRDTIVSQIMCVESWHLPSSCDSDDGRHVIAIDGAILHDEKWEEEDFPFVKLAYAPRTLGYWAQGLPEQLMGIQNEINRLLYTIQVGLHLCGVPKWLIEDGSKIVSAHVNNEIGGFIKYQGTAPVLQSFQVFPPELYAQLDRLVNMAYQQPGISLLAAASQKPAGLNSGIAMREYDDIQSDRFACLMQRYEGFYLDAAGKMFRKAKKISERDGSYATIYPGENSIVKVDFPDEQLEADDFIIQAYPASALSKDPAQRKQEVIDLMQAGLIDPTEGRRQLDFPDLKQVEQLLNAPEERILKVLDQIIEDGLYTPPDPFMDLQKAKTLVVQYYNKFITEELEEGKAEMLRTFSTALDVLMAPPPAAPMPGGPPMSGGEAPQAVPEAPPVSQLLPNAAGGMG